MANIQIMCRTLGPHLITIKVIVIVTKFLIQRIGYKRHKRKEKSTIYGRSAHFWMDAKTNHTFFGSKLHE